MSDTTADQPLTFDAAVQSLLAPASDATSVAATDDSGAGQATEEQPVEGAQPEAAAAAEAAENGAEDGEQDGGEPEEPVVALDPPKYWAKEAKEAFAALTPDLQAAVLAQEGPREAAAAKAKADAAEVRKAADAELSSVKALVGELANFLPAAVERFALQWGEPDWVDFASKYGADRMAVARAQYERDANDLKRLSAERLRAAQMVQDAEIKAEAEKLQDVEPALYGDAGKVLRDQVLSFLEKDGGIDKDALKLVSAQELSLAYDAMRWRQAQAKLKAAKPSAPKPTARPTSAARPAAGTGNHQVDAVKSARGRFDQNRSVENATALLLAMNKKE